MSARISLGLPVYNAAGDIENLLRSLLAQTMPEIEICISDNASSDGTQDILKRFATQDDRIRLHINEENQGVIANFRTVFKMAQGKYFCWVAADDLYDTRFIEALYEELSAHPKSSAAMCATRRILEDGTQKDVIRFVGADSPNNLTPLQQALRLITANSAMKSMKYNLQIMGLYRTSILRGVFNRHPDIMTMGDRILPAAIALSGRYRYVDEVLYTKRVYQSSYSKRQPDDPLVTTKKELSNFGYLSTALGWLASTPTIPWHRRLFLPIIAIRYYASIWRHDLVASMPDWLRITLKSMLRQQTT